MTVAMKNGVDDIRGREASRLSINKVALLEGSAPIMKAFALSPKPEM